MAQNAIDEDKIFFPMLENALIMQLVENGAIEKKMPIAALSTTGYVGEIRTFLLHLEEKRFSGQNINKREVFNKAKKI